MTKEELLERGDETVTIRQIVERFEVVEEEYSGMPWTLKQIYHQIDMLVSKKPYEDCISREAALKAIDAKAWEFCDYLISKGRNDEQKPVSHFADNLRECVGEDLPPVTPAPKIGHWIKCIDDNGSSYYLCSACRCREDCKFDFCPNCGSKMSEVEE